MKKTLVHFIFLFMVMTLYGRYTSCHHGYSISACTFNGRVNNSENQAGYLSEDDNIWFKGNVKKNGNVIYCRMIIFDKSSLATVYNENVCIGGSDFEIAIPKGKYNVYIRYYSPGDIPVEFENIEFRQDTTIYFNYNPVYPPSDLYAKIKSIYPTKIFLCTTNDSLKLECEITDKILFDTIFYINEFNNFSCHGNSFAKIAMNDNGMGGDRVANDGIYTSDYLTFNRERNLYKGNDEIGGVSISYLIFFQLKNGPADYYINVSNGSPAVAFCAEGNNPGKMVHLDDSVMMSDYLINVLSPKATQEFNLDELSTIYKQLLVDKNADDTFDFVNWFFPESSISGNLHTKVQQKIQGIGDELFDNSEHWGSNKKLIGTTSFYNLDTEYPIVHETMHQWGNCMDIFQQQEYLGHWGFSSVDGILGGFNEANLEIINDTLVRISNNKVAPYGKVFGVACSDLELYVAGLIPFSDLRNVFYVLNDPSQISYEQYKVSSISQISPEMIVNEYGSRIPLYSASQKEFNFLHIVVTQEPLDRAGFAFFNFLIKEFSHELGDYHIDHINYSFQGATNYTGKANSRLRNRYAEEITICEGENYKGWTHSGNYSLQVGDTVFVTRLTVIEKPVAADAIAGDTLVCKGTINKIYSISPVKGASSYSWTLPPGATGTSTTDSISVSFGENAISGTLNVRGHNVCGNGIESTMAVRVNSVPATVQSIEGEDTLCSGATGILYFTSPVEGADSYSWTLPSGATGNSTTDSIRVNFSELPLSGEIKVRGYNDCGFGAEKSKNITVWDIPESPIITVNDGVLQSDVSAGNQWYINDTVIQGANDASHSPAWDGNYYAIVTVNGCSSLPSNSIQYSHTTFNKSSEILNNRVYPNPTRDRIEIAMNELIESDYKIEMIDIFGNIIQLKAAKKVNKSILLDMSCFDRGIYLLRISTSNGIFQVKIIKE